MNRSALRWVLMVALVAAWPLTVSSLWAGEFPDAEPLRAAIRDLAATFSARYPRGTEFLARLDRVRTAAQFESLRREALLANPLTDRKFDFALTRLILPQGRS